jgi:hypothetical protein
VIDRSEVPIPGIRGAYAVDANNPPNDSNVSQPVLVGTNPNKWRRVINLHDFQRVGEFRNMPTGDVRYHQYVAEITAEECYHMMQWEGRVDTSQGGQGDCGTVKELVWWLKRTDEPPPNYSSTGWINATTPYVESTVSKTDAWNKAKAVLAYALGKEKAMLKEVFLRDRPFMEVKAKTYAGYNAYGKYHCTYSVAGKPIANNPYYENGVPQEDDVVNYTHPAYQ